MSLEGKTVVITGAASGIGAASARLMKGRGAKIIALDLKEPSAPFDLYIHLDLADESSIDTAVHKILDPVDALCNIAGVPPTRPAPLVLKINFLGLRYLTNAMISKFNAGASIVNLAAVAGSGWAGNIERIKAFLALKSLSEADAFAQEYGIDAEHSYGFSKEAMIVWTMQNFYTWKDKNIRINAISPGPVNTPILPDFLAVLSRAREDTALIDRYGEPHEVASVVAFLADPESSWMNGSNLAVDGGLMAALAGRQFNF